MTVRIALLVIAYYVAPLDRGPGDQLFARVAISVIVVAVAAALAVRSVFRADFPVIRAIEMATTVVCLMLLVFASTYVLMSRSDASAFSETLDHTGALYFTMTLATTIGFGDITPATESARVVVMIQMVVNVVLLGFGVRALASTARRRAQAS